MDSIELTIPSVHTAGDVSTMKLPDMGEFNTWSLYKNRIICLDGEIEDWDYNIAKTIIKFNIEDIGKEKSERKPIILLIHSCGGLLDIANALIDAINCSTTPVWTVNMGNALSGGCLIFLAGEKRFTMKNSWCMTHSGSGGLQGNFSETQEQSKVWNEQVKNMGTYIVERTGIEEKVWKKYKNKDWYLNADQQIEFGFATDKLENLNDLWRD